MSLPQLCFPICFSYPLNIRIKYAYRKAPGTLWAFHAWKVNVDLYLTGMDVGFMSRPWSLFKDLSPCF